MNEMRLLFDQPCYEMSPNGRLHWGQRSGKTHWLVFRKGGEQ